MKNPLEQLKQATGLSNSYFTSTSRYYGIETAVFEEQNDRKSTFVKRRFISQPDTFQLLQLHTVKEHERPDHIAHNFLGDAQQFWRICDANAVMHPNVLTNQQGSTIKITLPEGVNSSE